MQRLNHHHLYIFKIFGKFESFTKTAQELSIAQSAVTLQLRQLEEALELILIDRSNPRSPKITSEGRKVLEFAESIFESSQELLNWAVKGALSENRSIRIGALSGLSRNLQYEFMKPLIGKPGIKFEVTTADQKNLVSKLRNHEIDVILSSHNVLSESGRDYFSHVLLKSPVVFVMKPERNSRKKDLRSLAKEKAMYLPGNAFEAKPELEAYISKNKLTAQVAGEIDDIALLRILALQSEGIVAIPEMGVLNELKDKSLEVIERANQVEQKFYAITKSKKILNEDVEFLINTMRS